MWDYSDQAQSLGRQNIALCHTFSGKWDVDRQLSHLLFFIFTRFCAGQSCQEASITDLCRWNCLYSLLLCENIEIEIQQRFAATFLESGLILIFLLLQKPNKKHKKDSTKRIDLLFNSTLIQQSVVVCPKAVSVLISHLSRIYSVIFPLEF